MGSDVMGSVVPNRAMQRSSNVESSSRHAIQMHTTKRSPASAARVMPTRRSHAAAGCEDWRVGTSTKAGRVSASGWGEKPAQHFKAGHATQQA